MIYGLVIVGGLICLHAFEAEWLIFGGLLIAFLWAIDYGLKEKTYDKDNV